MYLVTVTHVALRTCFFYIVSGENSLQYALDACQEHQRMYGGEDEDLLMNAVKVPTHINKPVELMRLD